MNVNLKEKYGLFIGGQWRDASDGGTFKTYNPATGELADPGCAAAKFWMPKYEPGWELG